MQYLLSFDFEMYLYTSNYKNDQQLNRSLFTFSSFNREKGKTFKYNIYLTLFYEKKNIVTISSSKFMAHFFLLLNSAEKTYILYAFEEIGWRKNKCAVYIIHCT